jgi:methylmalonyl-CoA/ethylmalonyl-CoA epimerase
MNEVVLDHIAIAVGSLEFSQKVFEDIGFHFNPKREIVSAQKVETAFAPVDQHAHIELLKPTESAGAIYDFIQKKGPGIHHLCFKVTDVKSKCLELKKKGYQFIYPEPVEGAGHCLVNFIHPKTTGGVLIELSQPNGKN